MKAFLFSMMLLLNASVSMADTTTEIRYLLQFIEQSDCQFERNGHIYEAKEARAHIQRKYDYLKDRIETAEAFIRYAASQSSMTGKKYHAICNGQRLTSEAWLTQALEAFRAQSKAHAP